MGSYYHKLYVHDATLQIPITAMIEDTSGNVLQDGATQPVVKNR